MFYFFSPELLAWFLNAMLCLVFVLETSRSRLKGAGLMLIVEGKTDDLVDGIDVSFSSKLLEPLQDGDASDGEDQSRPSEQNKSLPEGCVDDDGNIDCAKLHSHSRRISSLWWQSNPLDNLTGLRLVMEAMRELLAAKLHLAAPRFDYEQMEKVAEQINQGQAVDRDFRVVVEAEQVVMFSSANFLNRIWSCPTHILGSRTSLTLGVC